MKKDLDAEWRAIARLIAADKEAARADLRRRPLAPAQPAKAPEPRRLRLVLLPVAAALLLAAGLAALWLLRGSWSSIPAAPPAGEILSDSFFYAAAGQAGPLTVPEARSSQSPFFTALAGNALRRQASDGTAAGSGADRKPAVERGDPERVRRAFGRALRENAFERALVYFKESHAQEA